MAKHLLQFRRYFWCLLWFYDICNKLHVHKETHSCEYKTSNLLWESIIMVFGGEKNNRNLSLNVQTYQWCHVLVCYDKFPQLVDGKPSCKNKRFHLLMDLTFPLKLRFQRSRSIFQALLIHETPKLPSFAVQINWLVSIWWQLWRLRS